MSNKRIIQVEEKVPFQLLLPLSIQHMFAMFGASVSGTIYFWYQSGNCSVYERSWQHCCLFLLQREKLPRI